MKKMTLKTYATQHKISIFKTVKLVRTGKLKSVTEEVNGKEILYILEESPALQALSDFPKIKSIEEQLKEDIIALQITIQELQKENQKLKERINPTDRE